MRLSIVLAATVPAVALTALMIGAIVSMSLSALRKERVSWLQFLFSIVWLLALETGVFLVVTVSAGLSHSSAAIHRLPWLYGLSFVSIVALPTAALMALRKWLNRRNRNEGRA